MPTVTQMKLRCTAKNSVRSAWFGCSVPSNGFKFIALGQMKSADMVNLALAFTQGVSRHKTRAMLGLTRLNFVLVAARCRGVPLVTTKM